MKPDMGGGADSLRFLIENLFGKISANLETFRLVHPGTEPGTHRLRVSHQPH